MADWRRIPGDRSGTYSYTWGNYNIINFGDLGWRVFLLGSTKPKEVDGGFGQRTLAQAKRIAEADAGGLLYFCPSSGLPRIGSVSA